MEEGILNTIFIHMSRNVIGYLLEIISRIAHRNTGACLPDDGNIIAAIAESHGFIYVQTQIVSHCWQALALIRIGCRNIRKGGCHLPEVQLRSVGIRSASCSTEQKGVTCRTCSSPSSFTSVRKISQFDPSPLAKIS